LRLVLTADAGLSPDELIPYGHTIAKTPVALLDKMSDQPDDKLILVTAMMASVLRILFFMGFPLRLIV